MLLMAMQACGGSTTTENAEDPAALDHADPAQVVAAIFAVASGKSEAQVLSTLCDPTGENDSDTRRICDNATGFDPGGEFAMFFKAGKLNGEATIEGGVAYVPFLFGPKGDEEETMELVNRDGKWYLSQF